VSLLGLDLGGSGFKAIVFDNTGRALASETVPWSILYPSPTKMELDAVAHWPDMFDALKRLASSPTVNADPVEALAISGAGEALIPIGRDGTPLHNIIATPDPRGTQQLRRLVQHISPELIYQITGQPADHKYCLLRALWFRENMPDLFSKVWKFLCLEDWFLFQLGMTPVFNHILAARTLAFDLMQRNWSREILDWADLDKDYFSIPVAPGTLIGPLPERVLREIGFRKQLAIVAGGMDQYCAALGAGVADETDAMVNTGSVEAVGVCTPRPMLGKDMLDGHFASFRYVQPDKFLVTGNCFTVGSLLTWHTKVFSFAEAEGAAEQGEDLFVRSIKAMPSKPTNIFVLPHFSGAYSPNRDPLSKGAILGLSLTTRTSDMTRAILEGTAYELRTILTYLSDRGIQPIKITAVGGGATSPEWLQVKADILNRPVQSPRVKHASALGAAMLAGLGIGTFSSLAEAKKSMVHIEEEYTPNPEKAEAYHKRYDIYRNVYPALRQIHAAITEIEASID
jgi:xylulokinase